MEQSQPGARGPEQARIIGELRERKRECQAQHPIEPLECEMCDTLSWAADFIAQVEHKTRETMVQVWTRWRQTMHDGSFSHSDGVRFLQMLDEAQETLKENQP